MDTIELLLQVSHLTNIAAFHAQQCVEKCFKAVLEEFGIEPVKTHNLVRLFALISKYLDDVNIDENMNTKLNELYIDSRYPADFGLLPDGKPSLKEAVEFFNYASYIYESVNSMLQ
ncbi:MAG: HEPN domain-containing protein [Desulfamplus sp.]|nr:HEPN domain-containing protein [Desulfamplus sp.]